MKTIKEIQVGLLIMLSLILVSFTSCEKDDLYATIKVVEPDNKNGDIIGNGGSATKTWTFTNPNTRVGWDMTINDATSGSFQLILKDASGTVVLDNTLTAGSGPQSADGTTPEGGVAGTWNCTIKLTNFNGTGDYSFL